MTEETGRERTLILLRHAKAEPGEELLDVDRPLSPRGRAEAAQVGVWLAAQGLVPDLVLCSPALRTRQTWQEVSAGLSGTPTTEGPADATVAPDPAGGSLGTTGGVRAGYGGGVVGATGSPPEGGPAGSAPVVSYEPGIYEAPPRGLLVLVRSVPPEAARVLLVAHNPGVSLLSGLLDSTRPVGEGLRTAELVVHRFRSSWAELEPGEAPVTARSRPGRPD